MCPMNILYVFFQFKTTTIDNELFINIVLFNFMRSIMVCPLEVDQPYWSVCGALSFLRLF